MKAYVKSMAPPLFLAKKEVLRILFLGIKLFSGMRGWARMPMARSERRATC